MWALAISLCTATLMFFIMNQPRGGITSLEQPLGSCMPQTNMFRSTWNSLQWNYVVAWLGAYGAESKKPIKVFSPVPWTKTNVKPLDSSRRFQTLCVTIDGKHTGKSKALKQSQHYPVDVGDTVAAELMQHNGEGPAVCPSWKATEEFIARHDWSLARLDNIHSWLGQQIRSGHNSSPAD